MLKLMVVLYRRPGMTVQEFGRYLAEVHGPIVRKLPGLRKYVQNYVTADGRRKHPGWDAIVEVYFDDWAAMEAAWASPQGTASDADMPYFLDLERTSWSVVEAVDATNG
jgi:uncharacterized protein (TIGR02118 family)